jgi:hypothetical protein
MEANSASKIVTKHAANAHAYIVKVHLYSNDGFPNLYDFPAPPGATVGFIAHAKVLKSKNSGISEKVAFSCRLGSHGPVP